MTLRDSWVSLWERISTLTLVTCLFDSIDGELMYHSHDKYAYV